MFVIGNLLSSVASVLNMVLSLYMWIIIIRAILSWVSPDPYNPIVRFLHAATDPVLDKVRQLLPFPTVYGGIDLTPIAVFVIIIFLQSFLVQTLFDLSPESGLRRGVSLPWQLSPTGLAVEVQVQPARHGTARIGHRLRAWLARLDNKKRDD